MKLKFCGFRSRIDIEKALKCEIDYLGIIFAKSKRKVDSEQAKAMIKGLDFGLVKLVGVFMDQRLEEVLEIAEYVGLEIIQLHGSESNDYIVELKSRFNGDVWKAIPGSEEYLIDFNEIPADLVLIDSTKGGGSGEAADWELIAKYQDNFKKPYFLAGGLKIDNIEAALQLLRPIGIDISSGIEIDGYKSLELMKEISRMVKNNG
ncbi:MAG: phosphoribosylanthranilate isomerase [Fusobacteria bacterium]|nr:MAG: phosphoribosylanthranilate isomerase [Fusobacteriota bacterium]KAF0230148.1 MAG: phosphoribosylanthranilate [Fusobacteriota bacterium]